VFYCVVKIFAIKSTVNLSDNKEINLVGTTIILGIFNDSVAGELFFVILLNFQVGRVFGIFFTKFRKT
jgi:hypothetical protein